MKSVFRALVYLIALLPLWIMYRLSDLLFVLMYYIAGYRKVVVMRNLANAFPEKTEEQRKYIARQFYQYLADVFIETLKSIAISKKSLASRCRVLDTPGSRHYFQNRQAALMMTGHLGNWEWAGLSVGLATAGKPVQVVFLKIKSPFFSRLMTDIRSRFGNEPVHMEYVYRQTLKKREEGIVSCILADQTPQPHQIGWWGMFLHQMTPFYTGPEKMAAKLGMPIYFGKTIRKGRGRYDIDITLLTENAAMLAEHELTALYAARLEQAIQQQPYNWLWSHKRWKHTYAGDKEQ